jgi:hypothetical protein
MVSKDINEVLKKYERKLEGSINSDLSNKRTSITQESLSNEFIQFKDDMLPHFSRYERWCNNLGNFLKLKLAQKDEEKLQKEINSAHLDVLPSQVVSLAIVSFIAVFVLGLLLTVAVYMFTLSFSFLLLFLFLLTAGFLFYYFYSTPKRLANQWRLKAGSQMVPCILYTVVYMKHTSNLERAISFASQHLEPPLALDLKKVFWDVETGKYSSIKESLDNYLEQWRTNNSEFIESFNLIESSLYEPSESRRIQILERALQVILDGVYDKMLKYTHDVKAPLTNLYMLGIVLPTLGLALIPLASALLNGMIKWYHVFILFNLIVPFLVFYMTSEVMMKRPGGYGESSLLELNPLYPNYKSKRHYWIAFFIAFPILILGLLPFIFHSEWFSNLTNLPTDFSFSQMGMSLFGDMKFFDFIQTDSGTVGPMGLFALLLSLLVILAISLFFSVSYLRKTKNIIQSRDNSKVLEGEFNNSLFQLGNRIGDGTPAELAFGRVAESAKGLVTENFFKTVNANIQSMGLPLEKAIFDRKRGAIINYTSNLISTSMHILIESVKKGLKVAAESLMSIADYVRNINKINDRLRDLLADVISDMKSNMTFLAPLLAGVVVGLSAMITLILGKLSSIVSIAASAGTDISSLGQIGTITSLFKVENMISPYFLQICIGLYIIEIIFILTKTLVTVDAGQDELKETNEIGKNLLRGTLLYLIVALIAVIVLSLVASVALSGLNI